MLYRYELKSHIKRILFLLLAVAICLLAILTNQKSYSSNENFDIITILPKFLKGILGISDFDITTISGSYLLMMQYVSLIFIFYAIYLGLKTTTNSIKNRSDFLYTILTRKKVILKKLIAHLTLLTFLIIGSFLIELILLLIFKEKNFSYLILTNLMLYLTLLLIYSIGMIIGAIFKNYKLSSNVSTILVLIFYLLNILGYSLNIKFFYYLSPWYYVINIDVLNSIINYYYIGLSMFLIILLTLISFLLFDKRDIS